VTDGVLHELTETQSPEPSSQSKTRGGRHARERTRKRDYAADFIRATLVEDARKAGLSLRAACQTVSDQLRGDAAGTSKVIVQAYKRVHARLAENPAAYYPLLSGWDLLWRARGQEGRKQTR
jgi:hypothetical protein